MLHSSPTERVTAFHEEATRLFNEARQPFGSYGNHARYLSEAGDLVEVEASALPTIMFEIPEPDTSGLRVTVETPLPQSKLWPNAYFEEAFVLGMKGTPIDSITDGFEYFLKLEEYTIDGDSDNSYIDAIASELSPSGTQNTALVDGSLVDQTKKTAIREFKRHRLELALREHPEFAARFQPRCTDEHFLGRLALLAGFSGQHEVGPLADLHVIAES
ncbi:MAG TPA: hypothetical protein VFH99_00255 [Candidatus Saccharimonadales bacterium]|nr:hypothetical protein [Candidatus Saccharimonadales bacterium]